MAEPDQDDDDAAGSDRRRRHQIIIWAVIGVTIVAVLVLLSLPLLSFFNDPERVSAFVNDAGPWAPLAFIGIQIGQVFAAPIPGQVTGFVGGFLFGATMGSVYATIGGTIGCTLVFILSRRLGRPFVERFVRAKVLQRFDYIIDQSGALALLVIFLVPIFPDDLICYIAGLTRIPISRLVLVALVGRIPGYVLFSLTGAGLAESNTTLIVVVVVVIAVAAGIAFWQRGRIEMLIRRLGGRGGPKQATNLTASATGATAADSEKDGQRHDDSSAQT